MTAAATYDGTSRTISVGSGDLHYHEAGDGPPLLLLHRLLLMRDNEIGLGPAGDPLA